VLGCPARGSGLGGVPLQVCDGLGERGEADDELDLLDGLSPLASDAADSSRAAARRLLPAGVG
jgi:hypothetical protein